MSEDRSVTDLVARARDGDKWAWDDLVERYAPRWPGRIPLLAGWLAAGGHHQHVRGGATRVRAVVSAAG